MTGATGHVLEIRPLAWIEARLREQKNTCELDIGAYFLGNISL